MINSRSICSVLLQSDCSSWPGISPISVTSPVVFSTLYNFYVLCVLHGTGSPLVDQQHFPLSAFPFMSTACVQCQAVCLNCLGLALLKKTKKTRTGQQVEGERKKRISWVLEGLNLRPRSIATSSQQRNKILKAAGDGLRGQGHPHNT